MHGISNGQQDAALQALRSAFAGNGWQPRQDDAAGQKIIKASTPDGYALIANLNDVGGLSLTGSSPCFPRANADAKAVGSSTIAHP